MTAALETSNLSVTLGDRTILSDINLAIHPGEIVGILGPNGAGKSTLIKTALGLIPPTIGTALLAGQPTTALTLVERARRAAYVPQDREAAWALTVEAIVALGRIAARSAFAAPSTEDHAAIAKAMMDADVMAIRDRRITELSGGERARVLIARALAQESPLLLADEPTSGLDPAHQLNLLTLFRKMSDAGRAIALSLHELHLATRWCDRLILLHEGGIAAEGKPDAVLTRENMLTVYGCDAHIIGTPNGPVIVPIPASNEEPNHDANR
jgi:iron complex transport system ATP-binding protein